MSCKQPLLSSVTSTSRKSFIILFLNDFDCECERIGISVQKRHASEEAYHADGISSTLNSPDTT